MALTTEKLIRRRGHGTIEEYKMAATKILAGAIVATNASGFAGPLTSSTFATALLGVAAETVDNTGGAAGAHSIRVRRGCAFAFKNAGTASVTQAHIGLKAGFVDDETVNNGTTPSLDPGSAAAARIDAIDPDGEVWVFIN